MRYGECSYCESAYFMYSNNIDIEGEKVFMFLSAVLKPLKPLPVYSEQPSFVLPMDLPVYVI